MIEIFIDGAARNNGTHKVNAACAVVVFEKKKPIIHYCRGSTAITNNEAEYEALLVALELCILSPYVSPIIYSDSAVVVNQVNGIWRCTKPRLLTLLLSVRIIQADYSFKLVHVNRKEVAVADELANKYLDMYESELAKIKTK